MSDTTPAQVLRFLRINAQGHDRAVGTQRIAEYFGLTDTRRVREIIAALRRQHEPVLSVSSGYYIPVSREDAAPGIHFLSQLFAPLRESYEGAIAGVDTMFKPSLFDTQEVA